MNILIAPNAYKECLSAPEAAKAIATGVREASPSSNCMIIPLADGGDGTVDALVSANDGEYIKLQVNDPLMRPVQAKYGLIDDGSTAVIEMAEASGLRLLQESEKNPLKTSTYGTGELIVDALKRGAKQIIIGIGGSATTDAGIGMAAALGYRFLDANGNELSPHGESMRRIVKIDTTHILQACFNAEIKIACDVTNPLLGTQGAAQVYGPQKGASPEMVNELETGLKNIADCIQQTLGISVHTITGGGAAGGLGAGLMAFCRAEIHSGFELISSITNLEEAIKTCDLVFTGEGKIDPSTAFGKVPHGVAMLAKKYNKPVTAFAGIINGNLDKLYEDGMTAVFAIQDGPLSLQESMARADELLHNTAFQVMKLWQARN